MTRSRVSKGFPREGGVLSRSLQGGKVGYLLVQKDRRETAAVLEGLRFISDCNMYDTSSEGNMNSSNKKNY